MSIFQRFKYNFIYLLKLVILYVTLINSFFFNKNIEFISGILGNIKAFLNTFNILLFLFFNFFTIAFVNILLSKCKYLRLIILILTCLSYNLYKILFKLIKLIELNFNLLKYILGI